MINNDNIQVDLAAFLGEYNAVSKSNKSSSRQLAIANLLLRFNEDIVKYQEEIILNMARYPKQKKVCVELGKKFQRSNPKIYKILKELQQKAKLKHKEIEACDKYGMPLEEYEELMAEFNYEVNQNAYSQGGSNDKLTPLQKAIVNENCTFVRVLVELGADIDLFGEKGLTPLGFAVERKSVQMIRLLGELGADFNLIDKAGRTPLIHAIKMMLPEIVELLIKFGAEVNRFDDRGWVPLKYAIKKKSPEMVYLLKALGADLNFCDKQRWTPLRFAIREKNLEMVQLLVELGADVNLNIENISTPLRSAIKQKSPELIKLLHKLGADLNFEDLDGWIPISYAIHLKLDDIARFLTQCGADINLPRSNGRTVLSQAIMQGNFTVIETLKSLGADEAFSQKIIRNVELAHVWGLAGRIPLEYHGDIKSLDLEGMFSFGGLTLLRDSATEFFNLTPQIKRSLSLSNQAVILKAIATANPLIQASNEAIETAIRAGEPRVILEGLVDHSIAFVFCNTKLIVCNRGYGKKSMVACRIFDLPNEKLAAAIAKSKEKFVEINNFEEMLAELNLTEVEGYKQKNQAVGNCEWASAKAAFGALCRQYAISDAEGQKIYKLFTKFCRRKSLERYLEDINPPDCNILKLINKKIKNKQGFDDCKLLINRALRKLNRKPKKRKLTALE